MSVSAICLHGSLDGSRSKDTDVQGIDQKAASSMHLTQKELDCFRLLSTSFGGRGRRHPVALQRAARGETPRKQLPDPEFSQAPIEATLTPDFNHMAASKRRRT
jgi:hypothetical protein